uniref:Molybdopterin synthase catalytic subunit n=1 Tax=Strigamia maritima TaxID=126957 RepID=T1JGT0_STRMM
MDFVEISEDPIVIESVYERVVSASCGAVATFVGTTRDHFQDRRVERLEYDAYVPMAEKEIRRICGRIRDQWAVENIAAVHRIGAVPIRDASVVIAVSSEHRAAALAATSYAIDALKAKVPIWKKEIYADDRHSAEWKENAECSWSRVNEVKNRDELKDE